MKYNSSSGSGSSGSSNNNNNWKKKNHSVTFTRCVACVYHHHSCVYSKSRWRVRPVGYDCCPDTVAIWSRNFSLIRLDTIWTVSAVWIPTVTHSIHIFASVDHIHLRTHTQHSHIPATAEPLFLPMPLPTAPPYTSPNNIRPIFFSLHAFTGK